ncbi:ferric reductase-like transmembrane domain-containing protein [uncultured Sulfitobacter sp.]|uniref:ferric reductase-like transmembrane domain-containing protein n=1 Tax=uncultured Sulfitobacter sp. TaxID=191468 RepID=UPI00260F655F|nr:ferric reductase-like transmembrane domain-containing protein [uncultured Sulfitobacter sp.]
MTSSKASLIWRGSIWVGVILTLLVPIGLAANSPLLAWRDSIYILGGFAGIIALALLLVQPLLISGFLPGISLGSARRLHRVVGAALLVSVVLHVGGLWVTSPPDVIDALLLSSPTVFSVWGVVAMWAGFASGGLALMRRRIGLRNWRKGHTALALIIVTGSVMHAMLIDGTMETFSKAALSSAVIVVTLFVTQRLQGGIFRPRQE